MVCQSAHLEIDFLDRVYLTRPPVSDGPRAEDFTPVFLGYADHEPAWPEKLGPQPNWYLVELADLVDEWREAIRDSRWYREQLHSDYASGRF